jgi:hypothetical protein
MTVCVKPVGRSPHNSHPVTTSAVYFADDMLHLVDPKTLYVLMLLETAHAPRYEREMRVYGLATSM